jgi:chlorobactene glucosyltransferase
MVSILVPARNEEQNIRKCIESLLKQDYPFYEILVVDDQSNDNTPVILKQMERIDSRLKVISGEPPPETMAGKNWACYQLARQAKGDLFFFTDADTIHAPQTLRLLATALFGEQADLLTGFPRQQMGTWGERLLVPFFSWASLSFMPLWLAYRVHRSDLAYAVGQVMLFRREAYQEIGGHESLNHAIVDDILLSKELQRAGLRWRVVSLSDLISSRMYHSWHEALEGFTKNYFAAFNHRLFTFLFVYIWLLVLFGLPLIQLVLAYSGVLPSSNVGELIVCTCLSIFLWFIPYREIKAPLFLTILYPITLLASEFVAFRSLFSSLKGDLRWKGRKLVSEKLTWR